MADQSLVGVPSEMQPHPVSAAPDQKRALSRWRRIGPLFFMGFGGLLGIGGLWWSAFWLTASTATDIQFTGMAMPEYQLAVRA